jgi:hypothetical protein
VDGQGGLERAWDWVALEPVHAIIAAGLALLLVALLALLADRQRRRRRNLDRVGCMPWTMIYVLSFFIASILLASALRATA